jgi:hypothetical protein
MDNDQIAEQVVVEATEMSPETDAATAEMQAVEDVPVMAVTETVAELSESSEDEDKEEEGEDEGEDEEEEDEDETQD